MHILVEQEPAEYVGRVAPDCPDSNVTEKTIINGGALLLRNSDIAQKMVDVWYHAIPQYPRLITGHYGDQSIFACVMSRHEDFSKYIHFDDTQFFQNFCNERFGGYRNAWIQHLSGRAKKEEKHVLMRAMNKHFVEMDDASQGVPYSIFSITRRGEAPKNY